MPVRARLSEISCVKSGCTSAKAALLGDVTEANGNAKERQRP